MVILGIISLTGLSTVRRKGGQEEIVWWLSFVLSRDGVWRAIAEVKTLGCDYVNRSTHMRFGLRKHVANNTSEENDLFFDVRCTPKTKNK